jgi:hypothetical protein
MKSRRYITIALGLALGCSTTEPTLLERAQQKLRSQGTVEEKPLEGCRYKSTELVANNARLVMTEDTCDIDPSKTGKDWVVKQYELTSGVDAKELEGSTPFFARMDGNGETHFTCAYADRWLAIRHDETEPDYSIGNDVATQGLRQFLGAKVNWKPTETRWGKAYSAGGGRTRNSHYCPR